MNTCCRDRETVTSHHYVWLLDKYVKRSYKTPLTFWAPLGLLCASLGATSVVNEEADHCRSYGDCNNDSSRNCDSCATDRLAPGVRSDLTGCWGWWTQEEDWNELCLARHLRLHTEFMQNIKNVCCNFLNRCIHLVGKGIRKHIECVTMGEITLDLYINIIAAPVLLKQVTTPVPTAVTVVDRLESQCRSINLNPWGVDRNGVSSSQHHPGDIFGSLWHWCHHVHWAAQVKRCAIPYAQFLKGLTV